MRRTYTDTIITEARALAAADDCGACVHVFDGPTNDAGHARPLRSGERLCSAPDAGEDVVFHARGEPLGPFGCDYRCPDCGESTGETT